MDTIRPWLVLLFSLCASGCFVDPRPYPPSGGGSGGQNLPGGSVGSPSPSSSLPLIHAQANASAGVADGDLGYVITANGQGGYRLAWTDTYGTTAEFHGSITTDGFFDSTQVAGFGGAYVTQVSDNQIDFDSAPGANVDGLDLVSSTDPIYLDLRVDGSTGGFGIYYTDGYSGVTTTTSYNPVAVTSP